MVVTVRRRVLRLLERRGYGPDAEAAQDPLVEESPVLAGITSASVLGQVAVGRRAGARVWRLGSEPDAPWIASTGPRQAHLDGFDLHADLRVAGHDRKRLEHLCRYLLRPPLAQERLRLLADGRVLVQLKRVWADGTSHLLFEPLEFLEKLAALTPRPRINLLLYHGVLGPHARWRSRIVPGPEAPTLEMGARLDDTRGASGNDTTGRPQPPRHWRWADLLRRAFDLAVLACPQCGNRMRLLATIEDPRVVEQTLTHLGPPSAPVRADPAHAPPATLCADTLA